MPRLVRGQAAMINVAAALPHGGLPSAVLAAPVAAAQWRIDLLTLKQNAGVLAEREIGCVVFGPRTKLDGARRQGRLNLWAPSKIVLDSAGTTPRDAGALAIWFADMMNATALLCIGAAVPQSGLRATSRPVDPPMLP